MRSQARMEAFDTTSGDMLDDYYIGKEREQPEISISSGTSAERKNPYIDVFSERVRPKEEKAKQVGWWLGRVDEMHKDYFTASLEDLQGRQSIAEFGNEEITPSDQNLLVPNARFSYTVTQMDKRSGREYVSKISLSGLPVWTGKDSDRAKESYEELFPKELFNF